MLEQIILGERKFTRSMLAHVDFSGWQVADHKRISVKDMALMTLKHSDRHKGFERKSFYLFKDGLRVLIAYKFTPFEDKRQDLNVVLELVDRSLEFGRPYIQYYMHHEDKEGAVTTTYYGKPSKTPLHVVAIREYMGVIRGVIGPWSDAYKYSSHERVGALIHYTVKARVAKAYAESKSDDILKAFPFYKLIDVHQMQKIIQKNFGENSVNLVHRPQRSSMLG